MTSTYRFSLILFFVNLLFFSGVAHGQNRNVAYFSNGKDAASKNFVAYSFSTINGKRSVINSYGSKMGRMLVIKYLGKTKTRKGFRVKSPNGTTLQIFPIGKRLKIYNERTIKTSWLSWMYMGPVDGVGTWCDSCIQEPLPAVRFVRKYFVLN